MKISCSSLLCITLVIFLLIFKMFFLHVSFVMYCTHSLNHYTTNIEDLLWSKNRVKCGKTKWLRSSTVLRTRHIESLVRLYCIHSIMNSTIVMEVKSIQSNPRINCQQNTVIPGIQITPTTCRTRIWYEQLEILLDSDKRSINSLNYLLNQETQM